MTVAAHLKRPEEPSCLVCGSGNSRVVRRESAGHSIIECGQCGVWAVRPRPAFEHLQSWYDEEYYAPGRLDAAARRRMWRIP